MNTIDLFKFYGFPLQIEFCKNESLIPRARNNLVAKAMADEKMTHMLFIDNDITWQPMDILKLVIDDKPLIGGVYPLKKYFFNKIQDGNVVQTWIDSKNNSNLKDFITDEQLIQSKLLNYNVNYSDNILNIDKNVAKVRHIATGFMMIQRNVITQMCASFPSTKYVDDVGFLQEHENAFAYALFDCGVEFGHYLSEDWLFCERWTKINTSNSVYINVSINLTHTGQADYQGSYIASL